MHWLLVFFYVLFSIEIIDLYWQILLNSWNYLYLKMECLEKIECLKNIKTISIKVAYLRLLESVAEALPQLTLQIYIVASTPESGKCAMTHLINVGIIHTTVYLKDIE